jgi:hypothetical protein
MYDDPIESMIRRHMLKTGLAELMATYLENTDDPSRIWPILNLLGCPYIERVRGVTQVLRSKPPHRESEGLVYETLVHLLRTVVPEEGFFRNPEACFSVLAGLAFNDRWRQCLGSIDSAYLLAASLVEFCLMSSTSNSGERLREDVSINVRHIIKEWAGLVIHSWDPPQPDMIAIALFGGTWLDIAVGGTHPYFEIPDAIRSQRPPFLAGLVPAQVEVAAISLPGLDVHTLCP